MALALSSLSSRVAHLPLEAPEVALLALDARAHTGTRAHTWLGQEPYLVPAGVPQLGLRGISQVYPTASGLLCQWPMASTAQN